MNEEIISQYGNHLRVRVCGICIQEHKILLINHTGLNDNNEFWAPPGGGLQFGETIEDCLKREFLEETNTTISVINFLKIREFIEPPLHAIELYYEVKIESGEVEKGFDPEMKEQIIKDIQWLNIEEVLGKGKGKFSGILEELFNQYNQKSL